MAPLFSGSRFQIPGYRNIAVFLVIGALIFAVTGCTSVPTAYVEPVPLTQADRTALNGRVFDATWQLVRDKHFDRHLRGVNWAAMPAKYRAEAVAAPDDAALYRVLDRMCNELHESHLTPLPPRRTHELRTARRMAVGMGWMPLEGRNVVTDLVPGSPAAEAGVQRN